MPFAPQAPPLSSVRNRRAPNSLSRSELSSPYARRASGAGAAAIVPAIAGLLLSVNLLAARTAGASDAVNPPAAALAAGRDAIHAAQDPDAATSLSPWILSVGLEGNGFGNVASSPGTINCGSQGASCTDEFVDGTLVTLTAVAEPESTFEGWSGDAACAEQLTMIADTVCTARFTAGPGEHVFANGFEGTP